MQLLEYFKQIVEEQERHLKLSIDEYQKNDQAFQKRKQVEQKRNLEYQKEQREFRKQQREFQKKQQQHQKRREYLDDILRQIKKKLIE
jgi:hypothetical protein